ncbi:plasmid stabilization protein [Acidocella aquatica]|uniref:Plasmid stabilization protein n=1 Tax=Acidocella aquatica TaxID=1922313 RepID=A0ABQ6A313_9PROT|nr:type II toxin-antitoxin system RelE/ParE family toxin [Acidocella aquatica]GLR66559.1 plasmid stabilization protein [Acidocella aquatica]
MIVRLLPDAEHDLDTIGDYIARDNPLRAVTFVIELSDKCNSLAEMPLGFPLVPRYEHRGVRLRVHGNYQIFYRAVGNPIDRIDVLHIIHGARNYAAILF